MQNWKIPATIIGVLILLGLGVAAYQFGILGGFVPNFSLPGTSGAGNTPSLERAIVFPTDLPEEVRAMAAKNIEDVRAKLLKNQTDITAWFDLAISYRVVGDHAGAVEIWEYISATNPTDGTSLHNLGEYYFHNMKEYPKAEGYYRRAIEVAPYLSADYMDLFDMYRYVYKQDTTAAADILKEGITKLPAREAIDVQLALARYYRDAGDKKNAQIYYLRAREEASLAGNMTLVRIIDSEVNALDR